MLHVRKNPKMEYRNTDGTRTLRESVLVNNTLLALRDLIKLKPPGAISGELAFSYYTKPVLALTIELAVRQPEDVPGELDGFNRMNGTSFEHAKTGVVVAFLTPLMLGIDEADMDKIMTDTIRVDDIAVVSKTGLTVIMLHDNDTKTMQDLADLISDGAPDLSAFSLTDRMQVDYQTLVAGR